MSSSLFDKVEANLHQVDDVNSQLDLPEGFLARSLTKVLAGLFIVFLINIREYKNDRHNKQVVDGQKCYEEVPKLAECSLGVDEVPLELGLTVNDLVLFIGVFIDIVNHHLFQI